MLHYAQLKALRDTNPNLVLSLTILLPHWLSQNFPAIKALLFTGENHAHQQNDESLLLVRDHADNMHREGLSYILVSNWSALHTSNGQETFWLSLQPCGPIMCPAWIKKKTKMMEMLFTEGIFTIFLDKIHQACRLLRVNEDRQLKHTKYSLVKFNHNLEIPP